VNYTSFAYNTLSDDLQLVTESVGSVEQARDVHWSGRPAGRGQKF